MAFFTDFIFGDPLALRYSLVCVALITCPLTALVVWRGLAHYREALVEAEGWSNNPVIEENTANTSPQTA